MGDTAAVLAAVKFDVSRTTRIDIGFTASDLHISWRIIGPKRAVSPTERTIAIGHLFRSASHRKTHRAAIARRFDRTHAHSSPAFLLRFPIVHHTHDVRQVPKPASPQSPDWPRLSADVLPDVQLRGREPDHAGATPQRGLGAPARRRESLLCCRVDGRGPHRRKRAGAPPSAASRLCAPLAQTASRPARRFAPPAAQE